MNYWMGVATLTGIYMIAILGVSILTGFTGLFSMGHAGFMAIGAYTSALITKTFHVPILVGVFCGMFTALAIGLIIGYPTLKLKGDYFVIATGSSNTQINALVDNVEKVLWEEAQEEPLHREGYRAGTWVLLDYGCIAIHVFNAEAREFYGLERLWRDGKPLDLTGVVD